MPRTMLRLWSPASQLSLLTISVVLSVAGSSAGEHIRSDSTSTTTLPAYSSPSLLGPSDPSSTPSTSKVLLGPSDPSSTPSSSKVLLGPSDPSSTPSSSKVLMGPSDPSSTPSSSKVLMGPSDPSSTPSSSKVLLGPLESLEATQNPSNPPEELQDPLESTGIIQNPKSTKSLAASNSSAILQDPFYSSEVPEYPSDSTDVLKDLRKTLNVSQNPLRALGTLQNPRRTSKGLLDSLRDVDFTHAALMSDSIRHPSMSFESDDVLESSLTQEVLRPTGSLPDVLRPPEKVQDERKLPQLDKDSLEASESIRHSTGASYTRQDLPDTQRDSPESLGPRGDTPKPNHFIRDIVSPSGLNDGSTESSKSILNDPQLSEPVNDAFNSSEYIQEELKPVESIQDVLKTLESIKHTLRSAESIQDVLNVSDSTQRRLRSSGSSREAFKTSASTRITQNEPLQGTIMLQDASRHAIIDADLLLRLSSEGTDRLRQRTAEGVAPSVRRFTGIGRPRALLPPGQKRRRRMFPRRFNRTRPLASSNPNVFAREGGAMAFSARRWYRKKPTKENPDVKDTVLEKENTQEVVEPVKVLEPTTATLPGHRPGPTTGRFTPDVADLWRAGLVNSHAIKKETNGKSTESETDTIISGGKSLADAATDDSRAPDYIPTTTLGPKYYDRVESRMYEQENPATYVGSEENPRYVLPSGAPAYLPTHLSQVPPHLLSHLSQVPPHLPNHLSQAPPHLPTHLSQAPAHLPSHLTPRVRSRKYDVASDGQPLRSEASKGPVLPPKAAPEQPAGPRPTTSSPPPSPYSPPTPPVVRPPLSPSPQVTSNLPPKHHHSPLLHLPFLTAFDDSPDGVHGLLKVYATNPFAPETRLQQHSTPKPSFLDSVPQGTPRQPWTEMYPSPTRPSTPAVHHTTPSTSQVEVPASYDPEAVIREILGSYRHRFLPSSHPYSRAAQTPPPERYTPTLPPVPRLPTSRPRPSPSPRPPPSPSTTLHRPPLTSRGPRHPPRPHNPPGPRHTRARSSPSPVAVPLTPDPSYDTITQPKPGYTRSRPVHNTPKIVHTTSRPSYKPYGPEYQPSNPTSSLPELGSVPSKAVPSTPRPVYVTSQPVLEDLTVHSTPGPYDRLQSLVNTNASPNKPIRRTPEVPGPAHGDYPTYGAVPLTSFSCADKLAGYYADPEAYCQVFHMCQHEGQQHSFLCPNGTLFNQQLLTCDHWRNVDCQKAPSYYGVNKKLYRVQKKEPFNKSKRQTYQHRASTATPSSHWLPETTSLSYRPITNNYVTIPSSHTVASLANSPYGAPIVESYVTTLPAFKAVMALAKLPYDEPIIDHRRSANEYIPPITS